MHLLPQSLGLSWSACAPCRHTATISGSLVLAAMLTVGLLLGLPPLLGTF